MKNSKIEEQLKRTEARLQKTKEEKKILQARKKMLAEQAENERLISRGKILESFLREPLVLTNDDVTYLLDLMFRSSFSQKKLSELIETKKPAKSVSGTQPTAIEFQEESHEQ